MNFLNIKIGRNFNHLTLLGKWSLELQKKKLGTEQVQAANKALHTDKIKLRSFLTTLYFAGELDRYITKMGFL